MLLNAYPATRNSVGPQVHIDQAELGGIANQLNGALECMVTIMIFICGSAPSIWRVSWMPLISGNDRSTIIKSGLSGLGFDHQNQKAAL